MEPHPSFLRCNGANLCVEELGQGPAVVLVHGAWTERRNWDAVFAPLAQHFRVIRYDRRGYGQSEASEAGTRVQSDDLLALIQNLGVKRVVLVGNSMGALVALRAAIDGGELISRVIAHEPPWLAFLKAQPAQEELAEQVYAAFRLCAEAARLGDSTKAAQIFVEQASFAPGAWRYLPPAMQQSYINGAGGFVSDMQVPPEQGISLEALAAMGNRVGITYGNRSVHFLRTIAMGMQRALPDAVRHVFNNAGHLPHQTHPADFVAHVAALVQQNALGD